MNAPKPHALPLPIVFLQFSGRFYDGISEFTGSPEETIQFAIRPLSPPQREELAAFIRLTLTNGMTDRELELVWLRGHGDMYPGRHMVRGFHETILQVLETDHSKKSVGNPPPS